MNVILSFLSRFVKWIPMNIMTILGVVRAVVKLIKEFATGLCNVLFPMFNPETNSFAKFVMRVRDFFNGLDAWLEKAQAFLLKLTGVSA